MVEEIMKMVSAAVYALIGPVMMVAHRLNEFLYNAIYETELFQVPEDMEACPICLLPFPLANLHKSYNSCCGKLICDGCMFMYDGTPSKVCAFCRTPMPSSPEEELARCRKRMKEHEDPYAWYCVGNFYRDGDAGLPRDAKKAFEYWTKATELGSAEAHESIAITILAGTHEHIAVGYFTGLFGKIINIVKAKYHLEEAVLGGVQSARWNLANLEMNTGSTKIAMRHYLIAAQLGLSLALEDVKKAYQSGHISKNEFEGALRDHFKASEAVTSEARDVAAAYSAKMYPQFAHVKYN